MMHGREKSDSAIVAVKPTNKVVPTAAGRNDGEPADQPTSPLAIRVGRMQTVQRKNADRGKQ
jgi:hypothetical protein